MTVRDRFSLDGRTAVITGGAGLLGREHAAALLESGAHVVLTDLHDDALEAAAEAVATSSTKERLSTQVMDVTDAASIDAVATRLERDGRHVSILVNNAAIDPKVVAGSLVETSRLEVLSRAQWDLQVAVGLTGAFLTAQRFGSVMASSGAGGVILNIASDLSVIAPDQRLYRRDDRPADQQPVKPVTYPVIKAGLVGLTRYLATYWAERGVRANALSPGGVQHGQDEVFLSRISALIPLGRMAARDEYRAAVQFLCSDASSYMTGQNVVMDGGRSVW